MNDDFQGFRKLNRLYEQHAEETYKFEDDQVKVILLLEEISKIDGLISIFPNIQNQNRFVAFRMVNGVAEFITEDKTVVQTGKLSFISFSEYELGQVPSILVSFEPINKINKDKNVEFLIYHKFDLHFGALKKLHPLAGHSFPLNIYE